MLRMSQFSKVQLAIDKAHIVPQRALCIEKTCKFIFPMFSFQLEGVGVGRRRLRKIKGITFLLSDIEILMVSLGY